MHAGKQAIVVVKHQPCHACTGFSYPSIRIIVTVSIIITLAVCQVMSGTNESISHPVVSSTPRGVQRDTISKQFTSTALPSLRRPQTHLLFQQHGAFLQKVCLLAFAASVGWVGKAEVR